MVLVSLKEAFKGHGDRELVRSLLVRSALLAAARAAGHGAVPTAGLRARLRRGRLLRRGTRLASALAVLSSS